MRRSDRRRRLAGFALHALLALSQGVADVSGRYFARCRAREIKSRFNSKSYRELLWNISMEYSQLAVREQPEPSPVDRGFRND
jgi:hypothetical protein